MLQKNGKEFTPSASDYIDPRTDKKLKFPAVFKLVPSRIKWDDLNKRNSLPRGFDFDPVYRIMMQAKGKNGKIASGQEEVEIRYYTSSRPITRGNLTTMEYHPLELGIPQNNELMIGERDKTLAWFLINHPRCSGGPNQNEKTPFFYLENKEFDADRKAEKRRINADVMALLYGESGFDDDMLRETASALGMQNVNDHTPNQCREFLEPLAIRDPKKFLQNTGGALMKYRSLVQRAIDYKIVAYEEEDKSWYILSETTGKIDEKICTVNLSENHKERLVRFATQTDEEFAKLLTRLVSEKEESMQEA